MPNTIVLKGRPTRKEEIAGGAITPGHLIMRNSDGEFVVHGTAGQRAQPIFAGEDEMQGKDIDEAYAENDRVLGWYAHSGCEIYALVPAGAAAIVVGNPLESAGDGTLRLAAGLTDSSGGTANTTVQAIGGSYTQAEVANNFADVTAAINRGRASMIAVALEAVDNSGGASPARIRVEII
jgi:hypothetical protein